MKKKKSIKRAVKIKSSKIKKTGSINYKDDFFRNIVDFAPDAIFVIDKKGYIQYVNAAAAAMHGKNSGQMVNKKHADFFPPEVYEIQKKAIGKIINTGHPVASEDNYSFFASGIWLQTRLVPLLNKKGEVEAVLGIGRDTTIRKKMELELIENKELYRALVDTSPDAIVVSDLKGHLVMVNQTASAMIGCTKPEELMGINSFELIAPEDRKPAVANFIRVLHEGIIKNAQYDFLKRDGSSFSGELSASLLCDAKGNPKGFIVVVRDITERKRIQEELSKAQKLESIGILAGGIAHDFNNILTSILSNISFVKGDQQLSGRLIEKLENAENAVAWAKDLTDQLLTFSKGGDPVKSLFDLSFILKSSAALMTNDINFKCEFHLPLNPVMILADSKQITQVFNNLFLNACQAVKEREKLSDIQLHPEDLTIMVKVEEVNTLEREIILLIEGKYVKISVRDRGNGIPKEHLKKIFDPYYTTKKNGVGLGLAITYSIIKKHNGYIDVESIPGKGTAFHVYLPVFAGTSSSVTASLSSSLESSGSPISAAVNKILLMDDDLFILKSVSQLLVSGGFQVETAEDGAEAVNLYKKSIEKNAPFAAVILDLTIPGGKMGGKETIIELLKLDPNVRAIVTSGYSNDTIMANYRDHGFKEVISKPYKIHDLNAKILKAIG